MTCHTCRRVECSTIYIGQNPELDAPGFSVEQNIGRVIMVCYLCPNALCQDAVGVRCQTHLLFPKETIASQLGLALLADTVANSRCHNDLVECHRL